MKELSGAARGIVCVLAAIGMIGPSVDARQASDTRSRRVIPLPEIEEPGDVRAEHGRVYIQDKKDIAVYSFDDGRFLRRFGRPGQGPGEFTYLAGLAVLSDRLIAFDISKALSFSIEGEYIGQFVPPRQVMAYPFLPVGDHFVGVPLEIQDDGTMTPFTVVVFDAALKQADRLVELPDVLAPPPPPPPAPGAASGPRPETLMIRGYFDYAVHDNKIFIADSSRGFFISVWDEGGDLLYEISHPLEKQKVSGEYREWAEGERPGVKPVWPDFFPAFTAMKIDGGRIYVVTSARKDGRSEVVVTDLQGKILERSFRLPLQSDLFMPHMSARKFDVEAGRFVWAEYNDSTDQYELHID
jgi:hypothetical protein